MEPYVFVGHSAPPLSTAEKPPAQPPPTPNPKMKKRTKTGCLTCRKRRIKCGEERPTCSNCHKSKRHCEGYSQRVVFKSAGQWTRSPNEGQTTLQYHSGTLPGQIRHGPMQFQQYVPPDQVGFVPPGYVFDQRGQMVPIMPPTPLTPATPMSAGPFAALGPNGAPMYVQHPQGAPHGGWPGIQQQVYTAYGGQQWAQATPSVVPPQAHQGASFGLPPHDSARLNFSSPQPTPQHEAAPPFEDQEAERVADTWNPLPKAEQADASVQQFQLRWHEERPQDSGAGLEDPEPIRRSSNTALPAYGQPAFVSPYEAMPSHYIPADTAQAGLSQSLTMDLPAPTQLAIDGPNELLQGAAVEVQDDDYHDYDPELDDTPIMADPQEDLSLIRRIHHQAISASSMRRYDAFIYPGVLDGYNAEDHASPLRNERTARVFAHFICATAPSLGIFERKPRNTEAIFGMGHQLHAQQQSLWTVALPLRALRDFGLLHAILALASLHIANLQGADTTPSVRHYLYAIRSVHKAVANEQRRHRVETLAATLLLGYYEVMTADHAKWCSHLLGARQLLNEIGYPSMTKQVRRMRAQEQAFRQMDEYGYPQAPFPMDNQASSQSITNIDEGLVSTIIGRKLRYDEFGHVVDAQDPAEGNPKSAISPGSEHVDLETYDLYQDLWWWFLRQDAYQSIVSGNGLLLNYARWSDCPPRARMGRSDATYGGHDHLMLMLGRIADFSSRDRRRKLRHIKSRGGQWAPPPQGFFPGLGNMPPPPSAPPSKGFPGPPGNPAHYGGAAGPQLGMSQTMPSFVGPSASSNVPGPQPPAGQPRYMGPNIPAPGMGVSRTPPQQVPQAPFMGMAPSSSRQWMPSSYQSLQQADESASPASSEGSTPDDEALTAALQEWSSIQSALSVLRSTYQPMLQPINTGTAITQPDAALKDVFGPSIHYRQFDVAVVNALYHLCYIILCRAHPNMPPASMVAAGVAASFTKDSAMQIGRIATGIFSQALSSLTTSRLNSNGTASDTVPGLNPSIGGMLCEMTMPLFFAGVQYRDAPQRKWLVDNMREIEVRCGWATAGMIGHGCETSWHRQAEAGRGPPYVRSGHWVKPDAEYGIKAPWSYGVRGGDRDAPPPAGMQALSGQQGVMTEGLPTRVKKHGARPSLGGDAGLVREEEIAALGGSNIAGQVEGEAMKQARRGVATSFAMGVMADDGRSG